MGMLCKIGFFVFAIIGAAFGQTVLDETVTEERFIPGYAVADAYFGWSDRAGFAGGSVQQEEAGFDFNAPIYMGEDLRLTAGLSYRHTKLDFQGAEPFGDDISFDLHRVHVPVNVWMDNGNWKYWLNLKPGVSGDLERIEGDTFTFSALALASYAFSEKLSFAMGAFYSQDLQDSRFLPALGFVWKPDPHWTLSLTVPRVEISYAPSAKWLFTAHALPSGGSWTVVDPDNTSRDMIVNYQSLCAGLTAEKQLGSGPAWAFVDAGYQFIQEIEVERSGQSTFEEDLDAVPYVKVGVKLRF
jgi:hypothetical protein